MEKTIKNSIDDWKKLKVEIERELSPDAPYDARLLQINVNVKGHVEYLIYSLPIVDSARILKWRCNLNINIDKKEKEMISSVSHFLCVQSIIREGLTITINYETLKQQTRFGKIQPVIATTYMLGSFCYQHLYEQEKSFDILFKLRPILIDMIIHEEYDDNIDKLNKIISSNSDIISPDFLSTNEKILKNKADQKIQWSELFNIQPNNDINLILCKFIMSNIVYMIENLTGDSKNKLSGEKKEKYTNKLFDYFEEIAQDLPLLSLYIWSILMRFLLIKKELVRYDTNNHDLFEPVMEITANRAISFGEGLYQLIENSCFHSGAKTGFFYLRVYGKSKGEEFKEEEKHIKSLQTLAKRYNPYKLSKSTDLYLELCFVDSAFDTKTSHGMIEHFNQTHSNKTVSSLKDLFDSFPVTEEDLTEHYGLRFFQRTVLNNKGTFCVSTPNSQNTANGYSYQITSEKIVEKNEDVYNGTVYRVVFPLILDYTSSTMLSKHDCNDVFKTTHILENIRPFCIRLNTKPEYNSIQSKNNSIEIIRNELEIAFPKNEELFNRIVCIKPTNFSFEQIEVFAKALIRVMLKRKAIPMKIALLMDEDYKIYEFIRVFSAFYDKHGGNFKNFELDKAEIALCRFKGDTTEVCLVLKGNSLESALKTARSFVYYQSDSLMKYMPTITYLTNVDSNDNHPQEKIFPFDLYLDIVDFDGYKNEKPEIDEDKTWFFKRINHILNNEMQFEPYGCKISNVHVSIGSKIHIDTFYNAEVLFHNYSNIFRFAYITAQALLKEHNDDDGKKLILIAYGEYSLMMIQKVCDIINAYENTNLQAEYFVFPSYLDEDDIKSRDEQESEFQSFINRHNIDESDHLTDYCFHIIIPVSTTLTTTIRIQNAIKRVGKKMSPKAKIEFGLSTTLVLVGGISDNTGVDNRYWEKVEPYSKQLVIQSSSKKGESSTFRTVRYFFNVEGKWYKAIDGECDLCNALKGKENRKALIGVDKTSTLPSAIFDSMVTPGRFFLLKGKKNTAQKIKVNNKRLSFLMGMVKYAHMTKNYNHFLYDIDYKSYTEKYEVKNEIDSWIDNYLVQKIDHSAFNVIVSPLHSSSSFFLKSVIERGFKGNCRIINLKFHDSYRDEVRSRLEFITNEYRNLKSLRLADKLHTYFVDDCIIEGTTLQRSKQFLYMLLSEYGIELSKLTIYKGIILLANRSSYDTINNLLPGRVENDFHYFVRVNVPSFNTRNGKCPACDLAEKYSLSHKQASTFLVAEEYRRLYEKHLGKTDMEYEKWLQDNSRKSDNYTVRLSYWIYYAVQKTSEGYGFADINGNLKLFTDSDYNVNPEYSYFKFLFKDFDLDSIMNGTAAPDFKSYFFSEAHTDKEIMEKRLLCLRTIVEKHINAERSYDRMICTHDLFMTMEQTLANNVGRVDNIQKYEKLLRKNILDLINNRLSVISSTAKKNKLTDTTINWLKAEWLISYCKVISRKQPGQYYHLRNAIYNILSDVLDQVLFDSKTNDDISFIAKMCTVNPTDRCAKKAMPDMTYRLFITVIRRLSAMYSSYLINHLDDIIAWFDKLEKQVKGQDEYSKFFSSEKSRRTYYQLVDVPSRQIFEFDITRLIKWISVSGLDDSKSCCIEKKLTDKLDSYSDSSECVKIAYLENTSVIYMGIRKLSLGCSNEKRTSDEICDYIKETFENAFFNIATPKKYYEMNPYKTFLQFMDYRKDYKAGHDKEFYRIIANQVLLFKRLCALEVLPDRIENPYDYVQICNYIRNIMHYHQCIIVSGHEKLSVLATSDIHTMYLENNLNEEILYELIDKYYQKYEDFSLDRVAQKYNIGKTEIFVLPVTFDEKNDSGTFVILYKNKIDSGKIKQADFCLSDLWSLRNILFVRDRFERVLRRDLDQLHNMIDSYNYIENISGSDVAKIMHISDLHVDSNNKEKHIKKINLMSAKENPDLLLITGDVINGNYSAAGLKEAYSSAESVIKALVKKIWAVKDEDEEYVKNDWKKRIIISLGNHDYASMNELMAHNKKRVTTSGTPGALGDIMIKHSYFIHFVHKLLGTDIDSLITFDMNRIINYKSLGLSVVNLNSNSNVNPLKTNKVRINQTEVDKLFKHSAHESFLVYMIHHTPLYDIDYIDDVYYLKDACLSEEVKKRINKYGINVKTQAETNKVWITLIKSMSNDFTSNKLPLKENKQKDLMKEILDLYKIYDDKNFEENNIDDFLYYCNSDDPKTDDKCRHIKYAIEEQNYSTDKDVDNFESFFEDHFAMLNKNTDKLRFIILGGHTHQARTLDDHFAGVFDKCEGVFEAGKLFGKSLNYYILNIGADKTQYTFEGARPAKKDLFDSTIQKIMDKPIP